MARNLMGCTTADVAVAASNGALQPGSGPWPVYTTGPYRDTSVAITDLTDMAGNPVSQVTFGADGVLRYYSPDGDTRTHWLDVGQGLRIAVRPVSIVGPAGNPGPPGPTAGPGSITTAMLAPGVANGLDHRSGPGGPEGVRAAAVGSTWTQTDAPVAVGGIVVWRKITGTGTTGWGVETGDTGWLTIAPANGWTAGQLKIRRTVRDVTIFAEGLSAAAATSDVFYTLPTGWAAVQTMRGALFTTAMVWRRVIASGASVSISGWSTADTLYGTLPPITALAASWPTVAP